MTTQHISRLQRSSAQRMMGVVLPVVLVILTILTGLVVTQVRRSTTDERLAANTRESVMMDSAVQTTLRWCEYRVVGFPFNTALAAGDGTDPAWKIAANWTTPASSLNFAGVNLMPGQASDPACVIEDVTCDLQPPVSPTGSSTSGCNGIDARWMKFRITARVQVNAPDLSGGMREMMSQSELRIYTD